MNFKTVGNGTSEGYCIVKTVEQKLNVKGVPYLDFLLSDASGEIVAKLWDYKESVHGKFEAGDFIKVRGTLSVYNGTDQFRIERIRFVNEDDDVDGSPTGIGFEGGLMGRIQLVSNLHFAPEVNIAFVRTEHEYLHQKRTYTSIDLEIPLLMRGIVLDKFYVTGGPQLNLNLSNDFDYDNKEAAEGYEEKIDEAKFTFGLAVGAGFNIIEGLFIDVRFYMGLMDLYPDVKSISDYEDGEIVSEGDDFSYISMKGAKMMKIKAGLSYWFI